MSVPSDYYKDPGCVRRMVKLVKGSPIPNGCCRGLLVGTAGTANISDGDGTQHTNVPLQVGYNPIIVTALAASGTADDIWALY